jgi:hypothetical protein
MESPESSYLKKVVERSYRCSARECGTIQIHDRLCGELLWEGLVHEFELDGCPGGAKLAFAWVAAANPDDTPIAYTALAIPPVETADAAVRAVMLESSTVLSTRGSGG